MASANAEAQCRSRRTNWHRTPPARDYARSNLSVWRTLRLAIGLPRIAFHIVVGVTIMACYFRFASRERRDRLIRWWSIGVLKIFGMQVRVAGPTQVLEPGSMLVMNHISWIDVYVIFAIQPVRFVAKAEIRGWPVIGSLCDGVGTLYIERGRRRAVHQTNQAIADLLNAGDRIGVFPEGTTSDGRSVLPFHANLIQAALAVNARIQPVAL